MSQIDLHYDLAALLRERRDQGLTGKGAEHPTASAPASAQTLVHNPQLALLRAVSTTGSIAKAATQLRQSYRHVWGALKAFEAQCGNPLIEWSRGTAASLTAFGQRLLYADDLAQARMAPHIAALKAELHRSIEQAFEPDSQITHMHASHDEALTLLQQHLMGLKAKPRLHLDVQFVGSVDAIRALNEGRCQIAGFHSLIGADMRSLSAKTYRPLLTPGLHKVMGFVQRTQGLGMAAGNPLGIHALADAAQPHVRWVNRAIGTGTRVLLDELLAKSKLRKNALRGYRRVEHSHHAAALAVAQGQADCALMLEHVAHSHGLVFVPLAQERFDWVCHKQALNLPQLKRLQDVLQSQAWRNKLSSLLGYQATPHSGQVLPMTQALPWWRFVD